MTKTQDWLDRYQKVMVPNYAPLNLMPASGQGSTLTDVEGKEYIDFTGGIAVLGTGHCHPRILEALTAQAHKLWHVSNYYANMPAIELAERLVELTDFEKVFFANSGSEVNEAALKLARRHAYNHHGENKNKIISFHKSFHGRSLFTVTAGGTDAYREGFGPLPPKMHHSVHNDLDALKEIMDEDTCAVIMEPIMAEGGIHGMDVEFARGVRELCDEHQALLIFDEVQTGMGRTGELFAYQGLGVVPDVLTVAKALGSGFPVGAMMTRSEIAQAFQPGTHGSTFGGNPLAMAVAKETLDLISEPETLQGVRDKGAYIVEKLRAMDNNLEYFSEIRGRGLLIGCQLTEARSGQAKTIVQKALEKGLMVLVAGPDVVRFAPSLLIDQEEIDRGLALFAECLQELA